MNTIWRLSEDQKICTKDPERKKKTFWFNLSVHLDRSDIELMSKIEKIKLFYKEIKEKILPLTMDQCIHYERSVCIVNV
jgi:hypothetical protein